MIECFAFSQFYMSRATHYASCYIKAYYSVGIYVIISGYFFKSAALTQFFYSGQRDELFLTSRQQKWLLSPKYPRYCTGQQDRLLLGKRRSKQFWAVASPSLHSCLVALPLRRSKTSATSRTFSIPINQISCFEQLPPPRLTRIAAWGNPSHIYLNKTICFSNNTHEC